MRIEDSAYRAATSRAAKALERAEHAEARALKAEQQLSAERKGWPMEQPLTDVPMDRQIVLLHRRLVEAEQQRDCLLAVCKEIAKADAAAFESLKSLNIEAAHFSPESVELHNKLLAAIRLVEPPTANS